MSVPAAPTSAPSEGRGRSPRTQHTQKQTVPCRSAAPPGGTGAGIVRIALSGDDSRPARRMRSGACPGLNWPITHIRGSIPATPDRLMEGTAEMKYQVVNPATGELEAEYPVATDAEITDVLERAHEGYRSWRNSSWEDRAQVLHRVATIYEERINELGAIITMEMGKTTAEAVGELEFTVGI